MPFPPPEQIRAWQSEWTDQYVVIAPDAPAAWQRFAGRVGRVVTVNFSGCAIVDFGDGAWYDVANFKTVLQLTTEPNAKEQYDSTANSAQKFPTRQS